MRIPAHLCLLLAFVSAAPPALLAADPPKTLPKLDLPDPTGKRWSDAMIAARGAVIVVTVPSLAQRRNQEGWATHLINERPKRDKAPFCVFVQDLKTSWFAGPARSQMRSAFKFDKTPLFLFDETGAGREAFKVKPNTTVVLVYCRNRKLLRVEREAPTKARAQALWSLLPAPRK